MKFRKPTVDYSELRPTNITSEKFRHLLLLLYWPVFYALFCFAENGYDKYITSLGKHFAVVYHPLDDVIPFNELFLFPYMFWFAYIVIMLLYTMFYDVEAFKGMMKFIMITYTIALICYYTYPTIQHLRPVTFERDNFLTDFMRDFYAYDTNTNVCPSIHVFGSFASTYAVLRAAGIGKVLKASACVMNVLICLSTVFLKQHSVVDVFVALPICFIAYFISFNYKGHTRKVKNKVAI